MSQLAGAFVNFQNYGVLTGNCITPPGSSEGCCEVKGWCADVVDGHGTLPYDPEPELSPNQIYGVADWSLFLRLNYEFPLFNVKMNSAEKGLVHGRNQWLLSEILEQAGIQYKDVVAAGAIVSMNAKFDCNFNEGTEGCNPVWMFDRLDKTSDTQARRPLLRYLLCL